MTAVDQEEKTVKVRLLDDFKESEVMFREGDEESSLLEMRVCTREEVERYFTTRNRGQEDDVTSARRALQDAKATRDTYASKASAFLLYFSLPEPAATPAKVPE